MDKRDPERGHMRYFYTKLGVLEGESTLKIGLAVDGGPIEYSLDSLDDPRVIRESVVPFNNFTGFLETTEDLPKVTRQLSPPPEITSTGSMAIPTPL